MNRQEFMRRLEYLLRSIPESERADALAYYNDYFDEAGIENEQQVIQELGSPETVAQIILEDYYREHQNNYAYSSSKMDYTGKYQQYQQTQQGKGASFGEKIKNLSTSTKILIVLGLVLTFPLWIGLVAGLFGLIVGLIGGLFGLVVGLGGAAVGILIAGIGCLVIGVIGLMTSPVEGVVAVGIGSLLTAISSLFILLFGLLAFKWLPVLVKAIVQWAKGLMNRQKGGCEI